MNTNVVNLCLLLVFPGLIIVTSIIPSITSSANLSTLQLVQIISRHGDRAPILPYPNDLYKNFSVYSHNGWGELTEMGAKQVYELGQYLRQRYDGFIPRKYRKRDFLMLSSDIDRAIMSGEANLAGLYELRSVPRSKDIFKEWQPVPIHTLPEEDDNMINGNANCPRYRALLQEYFHSEKMTKLAEENREFLDFIVEKSGLTAIVKNVEDTFQVQDALRCQRLHNLTLPTWVNSTVYDKLQMFKAYSFAWKVATDEMKRLKVGPLFARLMEEMRAKVGAATLILDDQEIPPYEEPIAYRKMYIFSGHDSTISGVLHTLNLFQPHIPPYAAALLIELHKKVDTGEFFIELYYRNDTTMEAYKLDLESWCGVPCSYQSFSTFVQNFIPGDWKQECQQQATLLSAVSSGMSGLPLMSAAPASGVNSYDDTNSHGGMPTVMHPLGMTAPGLLGFILAVVAITSLLASTILLSSFLKEKHRSTAAHSTMNSYHHLS